MIENKDEIIKKVKYDLSEERLNSLALFVKTSETTGYMDSDDIQTIKALIAFYTLMRTA